MSDHRPSTSTSPISAARPPRHRSAVPDCGFTARVSLVSGVLKRDSIISGPIHGITSTCNRAMNFLVAVTGDKSPRGALPCTFFNAVVFVPFAPARAGRGGGGGRRGGQGNGKEKERKEETVRCMRVRAVSLRFSVSARRRSRARKRTGTVNFARAGEHVTIQD